MPLSLELPPGLDRLMETIRDAGGRPYVVGGAVRDALFELRVEDQDFDIEVFGEDSTAVIDVSDFGSDRLLTSLSHQQLQE